MNAPLDAPARARIVDDLDHTLFVEAGAGSGKTTSLVGRFVSLVLAGADVTSIAAITFTEAAAAELRARVRESLEDVVAGREVRGVTVGDDAPATARAALEQLDRASISTLHAFAQRLLVAAPIEAGLPPAVEIHDEISSALRADERWGAFVSRLLDDDALEFPLRAALALGISTDHLRTVATVFNQNWDLLEGLDLEAERALVIDEADLAVSIQPLLDAAELARSLAETCTDPDDKLYRWIQDQMDDTLAPLRAATDDPFNLLQAAAAPPKCASVGRAANWPDDGKGAINRAWSDARERIVDARGRIADLVLRRLSVELVDFTLAEAEARRLDGQLEFHDLLVLARQVLRESGSVRQRLHDRFRHLLIDEFQDTDPIQVELAVRIAADPAHDTSRPWDEVDVDEGRLFFVGDPKQSIYRFRRADIDLFVRAAERHRDGATRLDTNFRAVAPIVEFCNALFGEAIRRITVSEHDEEEGFPGEVAQADYADLRAWRAPLDGDPGPAVLLVGHGEQEATADSLRVAEANDIAAALASAEAEGWLVHPEGDDRPRPCRWNDMAVLVPSRTSLPHLRRALNDAGVPYRLETGSLVYATTEVRDLLAVLRAIDDPGDEIAVVAALRSPAYGCGDDDLLAWRRAGGSWSYLGDGAEGDGPVAAGLADLRDRHLTRPFQTVPEIVDAVVRDRRLLEISLTTDDSRESWRVYRVVAEHARQFADADSGGIREFLRWAALQADDKRRATVPVLPEADVDAVRILTVHGAKGLEFGVTAVSGLSGNFPQSQRGPSVRFRPEGGFDVRMRSGLQTLQYDSRRTVEDVMGIQEGIRLLYVALTRARDHLVVSLHHRTYKTANGVKCHAQRVAQVLDGLDGPLPITRIAGSSSHRDDHGPDEERPIVLPAPVGGDVRPDDVDRWVAESAGWLRRRTATLDRGAGGGSVSATHLSRLLTGHEVPDDDIPEPVTEPWRRGRAGTSIGSAVHAVLQHTRLDDPAGDDLPGLAAWQSQVEGVVGAEAEIEAKARAALASPLVRRATAGRWWREVHVGVPVDAVVEPTAQVADLFEGFIDLLFEDDADLVVVDYKTDAVPDDGAVAAALGRYAPQGAAYAVALEAALGRPVSEVHFLFLRGDEAVDARVDDLDAAKARVRGALASYGVESS